MSSRGSGCWPSPTFLVVGLGALALVSCTPAMPTMSPPPTAFVEACSFGAPQTTPALDFATPTSAPALDAAPTARDPEMPSADVMAYPTLPPPALPTSIEAWQDAVVGVRVELANGRLRNQQGLVVADGTMLTVLDLTEEIAALSVRLADGSDSNATIERIDPRTGAALLSVSFEAQPAVAGLDAAVAPGEPVLLLSRDWNSDELIVEEALASPSLNAPDLVFALPAGYFPPTQRGTVVVADGTPIGLAGHARTWYGQQAVWGQMGGTDLPVVLLGAALHLLERSSPPPSIVPAGVVYHGQDRGQPVDGPETRALLAGPVQEVLDRLGEPVELENLGRHPRYVLPNKQTTMLELLFAAPQELRRTGGGLLGKARYIVLWWGRKDGAPDLVICGPNAEHLGGAFTTHGLRSFEELMEGAPSTSPHSIVAATRLPKLKGAPGPEDYQYPYVWELKPDKSAYAEHELVKLTFTVTNVSDWPIPLNYVPPRVTISSIREHRDVAVLRHGDGHRILDPGERASYTITWDQAHFEGELVLAGRYIAQAQVANLAANRLFEQGPRTELILE